MMVNHMNPKKMEDNEKDSNELDDNDEDEESDGSDVSDSDDSDDEGDDDDGDEDDNLSDDEEESDRDPVEIATLSAIEPSKSILLDQIQEEDTIIPTSEQENLEIQKILTRSYNSGNPVKSPLSTTNSVNNINSSNTTAYPAKNRDHDNIRRSSYGGSVSEKERSYTCISDHIDHNDISVRSSENKLEDLSDTKLHSLIQDPLDVNNNSFNATNANTSVNSKKSVTSKKKSKEELKNKIRSTSNSPKHRAKGGSDKDNPPAKKDKKEKRERKVSKSCVGYLRQKIKPNIIIVGICAMKKKTSSKPMHEIVSRLLKFEGIEVDIFEEDVILNDPVETWPLCDVLISFHSGGFPLDKAVDYANLRGI